VALFGPLQEPVFDFRYLDTWQTNADGLGRSLVLVNESIPPDQFGDAASWKASAENGGSPGAAEPIQPDLSATLVAGVLTIQCAGVPGTIYSLQQMDDFSSNSWQTIDTQSAPANGLIQFAPPILTSARFYRVISP
jgi:hypothetical protein